MKRLLVLLTLVAAPSIGAAYDGEYFVTCNLNPNGDNFLALRTCPSSKCEMVKKLPPEIFLLTWEPYGEGRWRKVSVVKGLSDHSLSGPTGWVFDKYICQVKF